jgi:hypothetical protein
LGVGETAVLSLAQERAPATAVLDDAAARTCAKAIIVRAALERLGESWGG